MNLKEGLCFFLSFHILSASNTPQLESRVYNEDYSVALRGVRVTKSSWQSNRLQPTVENSNVACASTCVDKFRKDNCYYDGTLLILDTFLGLRGPLLEPSISPVCLSVSPATSFPEFIDEL